VTCQEAGKQWRIEVRDNGIGIAPEDRDRAFALFQRLVTRERYEGTGIGLAACKKIVANHGGQIWIEANPARQGSCFVFSLPKS
jgi:signal transduction histidine kinase